MTRLDNQPPPSPSKPIVGRLPPIMPGRHEGDVLGFFGRGCSSWSTQGPDRLGSPLGSEGRASGGRHPSDRQDELLVLAVGPGGVLVGTYDGAEDGGSSGRASIRATATDRMNLAGRGEAG